jgi:hypothetical protein
MDTLPLPFIGWFFTLVSAAALALGTLLILILLRSGELQRRYLGYSFWNDLLLTAIWMLGLAGGIGVLRLQPWGRHLLELFCWALIVLASLSAASRLYSLKQPEPDAPPVNWLGAAGGIILIVLPLVVICAAAIMTLRSPEAQRLFSGN